MKNLIDEEIQELWKNAFRLRDIDETFIPNTPQRIKNFIEIFENDLKIRKESLLILANDLDIFKQEQYTSMFFKIKELLESPELIVVGDITFTNTSNYKLAKWIKDEAYFLDISIYKGGDCLITKFSKAKREYNALKRRIINSFYDYTDNDSKLIEKLILDLGHL